jgi:hypothetical protein
MAVFGAEGRGQRGGITRWAIEIARGTDEGVVGGDRVPSDGDHAAATALAALGGAGRAVRIRHAAAELEGPHIFGEDLSYVIL